MIKYSLALQCSGPTVGEKQQSSALLPNIDLKIGVFSQLDLFWVFTDNKIQPCVGLVCRALLPNIDLTISRGDQSSHSPQLQTCKYHLINIRYKKKIPSEMEVAPHYNC